jgi:DNA-binding FadR family transcriptional regulator
MSTIQSAIVDDLLRQLIEGRFPKGGKLPSERTLAAQYGVSRNVVREALSGIADRRLITIVPGRGAFAAAPSPLDASYTMERASLDRGATPADLVEARLLLEARAAALAAERASATEVERLRQLTRAVETPNLMRRTTFDLALHLGVATVARSIVIESLLVSIAPMTAELMLRSLSDPEVAREGLPHHDQLVEAIARGDPDGAQKAAQAHLGLSARAYGEDYTRPLEDLARAAVEQFSSVGERADLVEQISALVSRAVSLAAVRDEDAADDTTEDTHTERGP